MAHNSSSHDNSSHVLQSKACYLLYNADLIQQPSIDLLSDAIFQRAAHYQKITAGGRGQAWFIELSGLSAVLRCYQRGGLVAKFNRQNYLGFRAGYSRAFKEWRLLQWMYGQGLPVPQPIAASVCRWPFVFSPFYRARILLQRIAAAQTMDQCLCQGQMEPALWASIGACIRLFHNQGIYHADLNANNILLDAQQRVYLIDFDRAEQRRVSPGAVQWKVDNLQRLKRSLLKQQGLSSTYFFTDKGWQALLAAYNKEPVARA